MQAAIPGGLSYILADCDSNLATLLSYIGFIFQTIITSVDLSMASDPQVYLL